MTASTLVRFAADREPGRALDLGCARGDAVVWLAGRGWYAIGTEVAATALEHARANAACSGVTGRTAFERHDLSRSLPEGTFDLVSAMFLHSSVAFSRSDVLRRAAGTLVPGAATTTWDRVITDRVVPARPLTVWRSKV